MKINLLLTIAAAATLLTACNKDNEPETPWNGEIRLTTATASMDVQSRATQDLQSTQFAANEKVSVFIGEENAGKSTTYTQPLEFTANGTGGLTTTPASQPYFPQSGKGVNIYACYPQGAATDTTAAKDFTILADQSIDANYKSSDLMLGLPLKNPVTRTSDAVALTFTHQLSKINIELVAGAGVPNLDGAVVKLKSIVPTISFN
ncbi:MAG: fimbrillin family protein, partial [Angelakisella sp.]